MPGTISRKTRRVFAARVLVGVAAAVGLSASGFGSTRSAAARAVGGASWPASPAFAEEFGQTESPAKPNYHRRALLIAVAYPDPADRKTKVQDKIIDDAWPPLHTLADVAAIKSELINRFQYEPRDISVLNAVETTTHAAIIAAIKDLIAATEPGDTVYIHYSGHGSEVPNDGSLTGDQDVGSEPDGFDKTLVPSDYGHKNYQDPAVPKRDGKPICNEIRDYELKKLLIALRARRPRDVFLTFDCCHSGGITRGGPLVRGGYWTGPTPHLPSGTAPAARGTGVTGPPDVSAREFPGYVVLSATNSDQLDYETDADDGRSMGSLSYALCKAMDRSNSRTTYRDLMSEVSAILSVRVQGQTPQMEGPIDRTVLDGTAVAALPTIAVGVDDLDQPILKAGFLQGMSTGSTIALHFAGDGEKAEPIATATLKTADSVTSVLTVGAPVGKEFSQNQLVALIKGEDAEGATKKGKAPRAIVATVTSIHYPVQPLTVELSAHLPADQELALREALDSLSKEKIAVLAAPSSPKCDVQILTSQEAQRTQASKPLSRGGAVMHLPSDPNALVLAWQPGGTTEPSHPAAQPASAADVAAALRGEARRRLFSAIGSTGAPQAPDNLYNVQFRFVPVEVDPTSHQLKYKPIPRGGDATRFTAGDHAVLELRNIGSQPAYVTILNLQGDGKIGAIFPYPGIAADNRITTPDATLQIDKRPWYRPLRPEGQPYVFSFTDKDHNGVPYTNRSDVYKIFVTPNQADFNLLIDPDTLRARGGGARGADTPLGQLLRSVTTNARGELENMPPGSGYTVATQTYEVTPEAPR